jgi:ketosteroid isomerase-like protein
MKTLLPLLAAAGLVAGAALAQPAGPAPAVSPENQQLAVWYGDWTYTGETFATPVGPAGKFTGTMTGRPVQNGHAGEFYYLEKGPAGETRSLEIDFWDPVARDHAYIFLSNDGYAERGTFTMKGNLTTFATTILVEGKPHKIRGTETVAPDGLSFTKKIEVLVDQTWLPYTDSRFTKIAAPTAEQELVGLENEWCRAYLAKDTQAMGRIEANGWICTTGDGELVTRAEDIADVGSGAYAATEFKVEDLKVTVHGDTAVVTGRQTEKATYKGKDASGVFRITDTWIRRDGRWQCIASQLTKIAGP